jgi:Rha family phage regulatory protein
MNSLAIPNDIYGVTEKNGKPIVSSRYVSSVFHKRHDHVLRDIENIKIDLPKIGEPNWSFNFQESAYKDRGKKYPEYIMTRDGFTLLAMGFTGKKALQFKIAYIERFNQMEDFIKNLFEAKADFPEFAEAIMLSREEPKNHHFSNELNMINQIALGATAKQFREANNLSKVSSIRPYLTLEQIDSIKKLQRVDIGLIVAVPDYYERKKILTNYHSQRSGVRALA